MKFNLESSPHIKASDSVPKIMSRVIIALLPAALYGVIVFGAHVILLYTTAILTCVVTEVIVKLLRKRKPHIEDLSAVLTGLLLVMTCTANVTIPIVMIGSVIAIVFAKEVFGGLGCNIFNPALVGRAFLQVAFPGEMSTYPKIVNIPFGITGGTVEGFTDTITGGTIATIDPVNILTQSTPLSFMKYTYIDHIPFDFLTQIKVESVYYLQMFIGNTAGSIGEGSFLLLSLGAIFLIITKTINWRIPLGILISFVTINLIGNFTNPGTYGSPIYGILGGGFALGSCFMATDMVTSPNTQKGIWIYAFFIGAVLILLRMFGHTAEYMLYSILIGNMIVPLIDMFTIKKPLGKVEAQKLESTIANGGK